MILSPRFGYMALFHARPHSDPLRAAAGVARAQVVGAIACQPSVPGEDQFQNAGQTNGLEAARALLDQAGGDLVRHPSGRVHRGLESGISSRAKADDRSGRGAGRTQGAAGRGYGAAHSSVSGGRFGLSPFWLLRVWSVLHGVLSSWRFPAGEVLTITEGGGSPAGFRASCALAQCILAQRSKPLNRR
jgi:hypothetical protein